MGDFNKYEERVIDLMARNSLATISEHFIEKEVLTKDEFWKITEEVFNNIKKKVTEK